MQVLEKSGFDYENDKLICLGDVTDGWPQTRECIDELMKMKHLTMLLGNHDEWTMMYYTNQMDNQGRYSYFRAWTTQGGFATLKSLGDPTDHRYVEFLQKAKLYHITADNKAFAHAQIPSKAFVLNKCDSFQFIWERDMIGRASERRDAETIDERFDEIYVGHTPVINFKLRDPDKLVPQKWANVWAMDTWASGHGVISMMDTDSKKVFQSDECMKLYPDHPGRNGKSYNDMVSDGDV